MKDNTLWWARLVDLSLTCGIEASIGQALEFTNRIYNYGFMLAYEHPCRLYPLPHTAQAPRCLCETARFW